MAAGLTTTTTWGRDSLGDHQPRDERLLGDATTGQSALRGLRQGPLERDHPAVLLWGCVQRPGEPRAPREGREAEGRTAGGRIVNRVVSGGASAPQVIERPDLKRVESLWASPVYWRDARTGRRDSPRRPAASSSVTRNLLRGEPWPMEPAQYALLLVGWLAAFLLGKELQRGFAAWRERRRSH